MAISDRAAADIRAKQAHSTAVTTVARHEQSNRGNASMALRQGLRAALVELQRDLIEAYAPVVVDDASVRAELLDEIKRLMTALAISSCAHKRGSQAAPAARLLAEIQMGIDMGAAQPFDLRVHELTKERERQQPAARPPTSPARRKQDKFEILDSPREYDGDFPRSVGILGASVIFFDLDDFKALNTRFTEPVIDRTLLPALMRLVGSLVDGRGLAYAEGGDEFVIVLPNTNTALAEAFTSLLLERIRIAAFDVDGVAVSVTASAGIASSTTAEEGQACREAASKAKGVAKMAPTKGGWVVSSMRT